MTLNPFRWLVRQIPEDPSDEPGFWFLRLPKRCDWMRSVFRYHDYFYRIGPKYDMRLSDIDWRTFKALVIAAEVPEDPMERCHRANDICRYWRLARIGGHSLFNRHRDEISS